MNLIRLALRRPVSIVMVTICILAVGMLSVSQIPQDYLPRVEIPTIVVTTYYPGAAAENVQTLISKPLEEALASLAGLKSISSMSRRGISTIVLTMQWGTNTLVSGIQAREIIDAQFSRLPQDAMKPEVIPVNPNVRPLVTLGLTSDRMDLTSLRKMAQKELISDLQQVEGVGTILLVGGQEKEIHIEPEIHKMSSRGLTFATLAQLISASNFRYPAGSIKEGSKEYLIISDGEAKTIEELRTMALYSSKDRAYFQLHDIARIEYGSSDQRSLFVVDGIESIGVSITNRPDTNPVQVADLVLKKLSDLSKSYGEQVQIRVLDNAATEIRSSIDSLLYSLILGSFVAFLLVLIVSRNHILSLVLLLSIPISLSITIMLMRGTGLSLNIMSIGGLAIGVGMLIDNSVVVLESIDSQRKKGLSVLSAVQEVAMGVVGSTLTSIIVFVPLIFLPGIVGSLYKELALSVSFSLLASLFVSLGIVPVCYQLLTRKRTVRRQGAFFGEKMYARALKWLLRKPIRIALVIVPAAGLTILSIVFLPFKLSPPVTNRSIAIDLRADANSNMAGLLGKARTLHQILSTEPWHAISYARGGGEANDTEYLSNPENADNILHLLVQVEDKYLPQIDQIKQTLEQSFRDDQGISVGFRQDKISALIGIREGDQSFVVQSDQKEAIDRLYDRIAIDRIEPNGESKEIVLQPKREVLGQLGLSPLQVSQELQARYFGSYPGRIEVSGTSYDLRLKGSRLDTSSTQQLSETPILLANGQVSTIGNLSRIDEIYSQNSLLRVDRQYTVLVQASSNEVLQSELGDKTLRIRELNSSAIEENIAQIGLILCFALLFLYLYLGAQFESFVEPLYILSSIPLAIPGITLGLLAFGQYLNLNSMLGVVVLLGSVVNSSIFLRERIKHVRIQKPGASQATVVFAACIARFRPIVLTNLTTVLAIAPIAFEVFGPSDQKSMTIVIACGTIFSTILTLFVVPILSLRERRVGSAVTP